MIGVDTNVLVRLFVGDNPSQTKMATRFLSERTDSDPAFVSAVVICELVWVLRNVYGYGDEVIHDALASLLESSNVVVDRVEVVDQAVGKARETGADIADAIIAALADDAGSTKTMTFDRQAAERVPGMVLLT